jgi:uncharacterized protein
MGRILFFVLLGIGLYVAYRLWSAGRGRREDPGVMRRPASGETMVRCERCGLNLPQSEALGQGGRWYCGDEHRRLDRDEL